MPYPRIIYILLSAVLLLTASCDSDRDAKAPLRIKGALTIVAGSESKVIEPIILDFAARNGFRITMNYKGSVDMMLDLRAKNFAYDAVLPANSMWIRLGDNKLHRVSDEASIMRSPVVLGLKKSKASELGWIDRDVTVDDILTVIKQGRLRFAMTSATQSNSGASAYFGLLIGLAGKQEVLTGDDLKDASLQEKIKTIFKGVDRSSGSSGWLKDMFLQKYDYLDGMFNYEAMVIDANRELVREQREPLYVIYPVDGQAIADSTLAFVNKEDNKDRKEVFLALKEHLLKPEIQDKIFAYGFRTGLIGMNPENEDTSVYNSAWGINLARTISPITWPQAEVIEEALVLYQTSLRKPSFTVFLLDVSGSMEGEGLTDLKQAMTGILDQKLAGRYFLQASGRDVMAVVPFNKQPFSPSIFQGNTPEAMQKALSMVNGLTAGGGTNIYAPVIQAFKIFGQAGQEINRYLPAVILMTDGQSQDGSMNDIKTFWQSHEGGFRSAAGFRGDLWPGGRNPAQGDRPFYRGPDL